ncbi:MAG TPA: SEC-C metal-binding domain-containing protein, partial [Vicinamibacteria bacterium]|nr:SEC-C metal-binding domain-containing protein [Vicinamibacteria bacterium]
AKEKISKSFYPEIEEPVDFLAVHPLKGDLERMTADPQFARVEAFLAESERERVVALGGLHILATERHEARRIDNQLRGRAGRQGDPGSSRFYLSLEDDLMRIFGSDRISGLMLKLGMEEGVPIEHGLVTKSIERAQKQVEAQNFAVRKHLLEYDDVMNKQRKAIYDMRRKILEGKDTRDYVLNLAGEVVEWYLENYAGEKDDPDQWNLEGLHLALKETFGQDVPVGDLKTLGRSQLQETLTARVRTAFEEKERQVGPEQLLLHARMIMLQIVDTQWKDHLYSLDHLKEGIGLRGYGQRDPLVEYKKESFAMYQALMDRIDEEVLRWVYLYHAVPVDAVEELPPAVGNGRLAPGRPAFASGMPEGEVPPPGAGPGEMPPLARPRPRPSPFIPRQAPRNLTFNDPGAVLSGSRKPAGDEPKEAQGGTDDVHTVRREGPKVGRNDPCPCGSGRKYKKCHGS